MNELCPTDLSLQLRLSSSLVLVQDKPCLFVRTALEYLCHELSEEGLLAVNSFTPLIWLKVKIFFVVVGPSEQTSDFILRYKCVLATTLELREIY